MSKCATVGCQDAATHQMTYRLPRGGDLTNYLDEVCEDCLEEYSYRVSVKVLHTVSLADERADALTGARLVIG